MAQFKFTVVCDGGDEVEHSLPARNEVCEGRCYCSNCGADGDA